MLNPVGPIQTGGTVQTTAPEPAQARTSPATQGAAGERPVAAAIALTARAVDAPRQADRAAALPPDPRRSLLPPDPNAPTGPPPAFEASLLDRQRELGVQPPPARPDAPAQRAQALAAYETAVLRDMPKATEAPAGNNDPATVAADEVAQARPIGGDDTSAETDRTR